MEKTSTTVINRLPAGYALLRNTDATTPLLLHELSSCLTLILRVTKQGSPREGETGQCSGDCSGTTASAKTLAETNFNEDDGADDAETGEGGGFADVEAAHDDDYSFFDEGKAIPRACHITAKRKLCR